MTSACPIRVSVRVSKKGSYTFHWLYPGCSDWVRNDHMTWFSPIRVSFRTCKQGWQKASALRGGEDRTLGCHLVTVEKSEGFWPWRFGPGKEARLNEGKDFRWKKEQTEFWYHWSHESNCTWSWACVLGILGQESTNPSPFFLFLNLKIFFPFFFLNWSIVDFMDHSLVMEKRLK